MEILCFFAGVVFVCTKNPWFLCFLFIVLVFKPRLAMVVWFLAAIVWSVCHEGWISERGMPKTNVIQSAMLEGHVVSIPSIRANKTQFQFQLTHQNHHPASARLLLSCYNHCPDFRAGQVWQLNAKLQQAQNLANPGGFDYVSWLHARHMRWTGYVRGGSSHLVRNNVNDYSMLSFRQAMAATLKKIDPDLNTLGILQALTLGITIVPVK